MPNKSFIYALATLSGTIIGVGLFSLPYITVKAGFLTILAYFLLLGAVVIVTGLMYGEITLRTEGQHRLPGYAEKYLGQGGKNITFLTNSIGLYGAILAYLIVGGTFLTSFFEQIFGHHEILFTVIFFAAGAALIFFGIKSIAQTELFGLILFFLVLLVIFIKGFSSINLGNLFDFDSNYLFLPYGAVLFSISGTALIPEIKEMLKESPRALKKVIPWAIVVPVITYLIFIVLVTGITGDKTSEEAINGLGAFFGGRLVAFLLIFGIMTTFTSYISLGLTLKKIFWYDFKINKHLSWALVCFVPLVLFFLGLDNFIDVISFTGGVMLAIDLAIITIIYKIAKTKGELKPAYSLSLPKIVPYILMLLFGIGIIYQIYYFIA